MIELINKRTSHITGRPTQHWDIYVDDVHVANLGHSSRRWSVLAQNPAQDYAVFNTKAEALAYAAGLTQ